MATAAVVQKDAAYVGRMSSAVDESVQAAWARQPVSERLRKMHAAGRALAGAHRELVDAIPSTLARTRADTYAAEVLPLLAACRYLVRSAGALLKPRRLGRKGLPFWLAGVHTAVHRVPFGTVLVIGPENYPLFLPGVQALQALAAGNAVVWKPGRGGRAVAEVFAAALRRAGLPVGLLRVTDESLEAAVTEIQSGVDKIVFTGSGASGRAVLKLAAETATPVVAELSGCDAVVVLPSADRARVLDALCFGMRLNGSATCMAPRRLFLVGDGHGSLLTGLRERFAAMEAVAVRPETAEALRELVLDAEAKGATTYGEVDAAAMKPLLVLGGLPDMRIAQADISAPVLTVIRATGAEAVIAADRQCPFGLTAAVFGDGREARALGVRLHVGIVLVNDLIVPTADPRISFGGRRGSGFGSTRGAEGLLEMTAVKSVAVRRSRTTRHYEPTGERHEVLFAGVVRMSYGATVRGRMAGLWSMVSTARKLR